MANNKSRLATTISDDLLKALKIQAVNENKKLNEMLEIIIKQYLEQQGKK